MSLEQQIFLLLNLTRRESEYGTEITPRSSWYQFNGPGLMQFNQEAYSDIEEINGTQYEKSSTVVKKMTKGTISFRISPELFPYFLGAMMANLSTTGTTNFVHLIKAPGAGTNQPWSIGATQAQDRSDTGSFAGYDGLVPNSTEFSIDDAGIIPCTVEVLGDGSETDKSATPPPDLNSILSTTQMLKKDLKVYLDNSDGSTEITAQFRRLNFRINANIQQIWTPASGEKVGEVYYGSGANPSVECELILKGRRGGAFYNYYSQQTSLVLKVNLIDTDDSNKFIKFTGHQCHVDPAAGDVLDYDETGPIIRMPLIFQYDPTEATPWTWEIGNTIPLYLAPS